MKNWFKNAIIYALDIGVFKDYNKDGIGDFVGLNKNLEYLSGLGVTCLWLLPFYQSPFKDNGYDVSNYYDVDPRFGSLGDFVELLDLAEEYSLRIIIDLPINHTSDQHYWFQEARKDKNSRFRNFYIWAKEKPEEDDKKIIFGGEQTSNWKYDEVAGEYFYHTFYDFQPDLNYTNPEVQREIRKVMHFWLRLGVAGFRVDAVPHMIRNKGDAIFNHAPHDVLRGFREFIDEVKNDAVLLGEVDVEPEHYKEFFGEGKEMHMLLNFYLANYMFLAFATRDAQPLIRAIEKLPPTRKYEQYANFLRNHDELDLERLTKDEFEKVINTFAPEENMRAFGRGIRRRLASMLQNDKRRIELAYSLLFSLPGIPVIMYGDEIGMGDDLSLKGRDSVRTVMQWSDSANAGFSDAPKEMLVKPAIEEGEFGYRKNNINEQMRNRESLLSWMELLIRVRKKCIEFGRGDHQIIKTNQSSVLMLCAKMPDSVAVVAHNFSDQACDVEFDLDEQTAGLLTDLFGDEPYDNYEKGKPFHLNPYGYRWFQGTVNYVKDEPL